MKKTIIVCSALLSLGLASCGSSAEKKMSESVDSEITKTTDEVKSTTETKTVDVKMGDKEVKIGADGSVKVDGAKADVNVGKSGVEVKTGDKSVEISTDGVKMK